MLRVSQVKVKPEHSRDQLKRCAAAMLRIPEEEIQELQVVRRSVDARKKPEIFYQYSLDIKVKNEEKILRRFRGKENQVCRAAEKAYRFPASGTVPREEPTVIVGAGPAGLFCAYFLAVHGYAVILLERGKAVEERQKDVEAFWDGGSLNPDSNVQFGEGGAGTFSDGKLNTLVKDKDGRNRIVLETLVKFGAQESICYEAKPHMGTDVLSHVVTRMRQEILRLGGQAYFGRRVTDICIRQNQVIGVKTACGETFSCGQLVLAIGHSARDTFSMLYERQIPMEAKAFAVGLRVEHPQALINQSQYGMPDPGALGAAAYKVAAKAKNGRGVYSFCMCPGGYVVNASSEEGHLAVNGMSYSARDGKNANSAIIVTVGPEDFGTESPLAGIAFQRRLEKKAFELGNGKIPAQCYGDFKDRVEGKRHKTEEIHTEKQISRDDSLPLCKGACQWADVSGILPEECNAAIVEGMEAFGRQISGFNSPDACLLGVESRTSSPVRILRDESLQSRVRGLYPCGEGAGYAGGIMSAAMDGIRVAEAIARKYAPGRCGQ